MNSITVEQLINNIPILWREFIGEDELKKDYWLNIVNILNNKPFYPQFEDIFNCLKIIKPKDVKVIIIGQDPYIKEQQAIGLAFAVKDGLTIPPSLRNIYKEILREYDINKQLKEYNKHGDLSILSNEGVLLLNSILTVERNKSNSHKGIGWEQFTIAIIKAIDKNNNCVFLGFGNNAKEVIIKHVKYNNYLLFGHPSPLNTTNPFIGCDCFRVCNEVLTKKGLSVVNWLKVFSYY